MTGECDCETCLKASNSECECVCHEVISAASISRASADYIRRRLSAAGEMAKALAPFAALYHETYDANRPDHEERQVPCGWENVGTDSTYGQIRAARAALAAWKKSE